MRILDCWYRGAVHLWAEDGGRRALTRVPYPRTFLFHLPDPHRYREMLEALAAAFPFEECTFRTVSGPVEGYRIGAGREVAERIEQQTRYEAELYNVDVRMDQRYLAEEGLVPCTAEGESRFTLATDFPLRTMGVRVRGSPHRGDPVTDLEVTGEGRAERFAGSERDVLEGFMDRIGALDPDVILFPSAEGWMDRVVRQARALGVGDTLSRTGRYRSMEERSYWSYGRVYHKGKALIPEGRILIDTDHSFVYREGGMRGVIMAARLSGISPNLSARFTPGTLISGYEVYGALREGIAVPFRKRDAEGLRDVAELRSCDRGGMIFQPHPGVYGGVDAMDFTSLYPAIIVRHNLSPELLDGRPGQGFLPRVLAPLLDLRIETKQRKKTDPSVAGIDAVLKWMLVTCFGYTGYRNAKFGQIQVHEQITGTAREILVRTKEMAEELGFEVLHGIVDCVWVRGEGIRELQERVERETGIPVECERYDWIAFLPQADGSGHYNRYFGRLAGGSVKVRGIALRRGDTPEYLRRMQGEMLDALVQARSPGEIPHLEPEVRGIRDRYLAGLAAADPGELVIRRRVSRLRYAHRCLEEAAVEAYRRQGIDIAPGMEIGYVVRDARHWAVDVADASSSVDLAFYRLLLEKAWEEVAFVFRAAGAADPAPVQVLLPRAEKEPTMHQTAGEATTPDSV
ncbi:MAG: type B DNA-directed DNA polymerase, partial [Methanomicrobiales archaeon]|nr:type B DNA-directed DNA polymerase [Methanomicrobiales archaeon]